MNDNKLMELGQFQKCPYCDKIYMWKGLRIHIFQSHPQIINEMQKLYNKLSKKEQQLIKIGGMKWEKF